MKTLGTLFLTPLIIGLTFAVSGLTNPWHGGLGLLAILLVGVIVATLFNFAVFAPVYWLLGKRHQRKNKTETKPGP